jgi:chitin disaccharide deacetylase
MLITIIVMGIKVNPINPQNISTSKSLAEKLGYAADSKLLIIHNDDVGLAHAVNMASFESFKNGIVNSGSIMVPCPWFAEAATLANENPEFDFGIHLTLTAEWKDYRWGGVTPLKSLLDPKGFLYPDVPDVIANADLQKVENECRAQIERAIAFGIQPTHFDTHMGTLFGSPDYTKIYLKLSKEYQIPVFLPRESIAESHPEMIQMLEHEGFIMVDRYFMAEPNVNPERWEEYYVGLIENLKPGVSQIIIHVGFDTDELQAVMIDHPHYGSAWRQRDFDVLNGEKIKDTIKDNNVKLVTWREIGKLLK